MDKNNKKNNRMNKKKSGHKNIEENKIKKDAKISSYETEKIKILKNNSKEKKKESVYLNRNNKIEMRYNTIINQDRNESCVNNLSKKHAYKIRKLYFFQKMIILSISFLLFFCECRQRNISFKLSEITLRVNETENLKLFSNDFFQKHKNYEIYYNSSLLYIEGTNYYNESNYI